MSQSITATPPNPENSPPQLESVDRLPTDVLTGRPGPGLEHAAQSFRQFLEQHGPEAPPGVEGWCASYEGSADHGALFRDLHCSNPNSAVELAKAILELPQVGSHFAGFELLQELGQGVFGRVYLATQADLAHRYVVLKITARKCGEPQVLARLQHTNVVPVYSAHREGPFHAICMPYLGSTTLADVLGHLQIGPPPASGHSLVQSLHMRRHSLPDDQETTPQRFPQPLLPALVEKPHAATARMAAGRTKTILDMLNRLNYVDAILWLIARLAEGLAHAHERGILHSDLKPANVLLTDEGQPMLLDFNLAVDTSAQIQGHTATIGGTLPYMAPEHLELFNGGSLPVDGRSDLYSLGVIFYELLTCRHPFSKRSGPLLEQLPALLAERRQTPAVRRWNRAVSPAVASLVSKCLEPDPTRRYQSARDLLEDLERQRVHLPLKHAPNPSLVERLVKWKRRHPALTSLTAVVAVAGLVVAALLLLLSLRSQHLERLEALETWQQFQQDARAAQLGIHARLGERDELVQGMTACRRALHHYQILDDMLWRERPAVTQLPDAQRTQLPEQLADLLLLSAQGTLLLLPADADTATRQSAAGEALKLNSLAEACFSSHEVPRAVWEQRRHLHQLLGQETEATRLRMQTAAMPLRTARDHYWEGIEHFLASRYHKAVPLLEESVRLQPRSFRAWFVLARCHDATGRNGDAVACYGTCIALEPEYLWSYFNRGLAYLRGRQFDKARADFDKTIAHQPQLADAYINRALALRGLRKYPEAIADLTTALNLGAPQTRIYFMRALVWDQLGAKGKSEAQADRAEGLKRQPTDEKSWIARGLARKQRDPRGALADLDAALWLNPRSVDALQNKGHVWADYMPLRGCDLPFPASLAHHLFMAKTRCEHTLQALAALNQALALAPDSMPARSGRAILLARLGKRSAALADGREVLTQETTPARLYGVGCVFALTTRLQPDDRLEAVRLLSAALRQGFGADLIERDSDLSALRRFPEFRRLVEAARGLRAMKN